eukprot:14405060-Ditylum_brightwellii.AAC.1
MVSKGPPWSGHTSKGNESWKIKLEENKGSTFEYNKIGLKDCESSCADKKTHQFGQEAKTCG